MHDTQFRTDAFPARLLDDCPPGALPTTALRTRSLATRAHLVAAPKIQREQTAETEALLQLFREFEQLAPMPSSGRWAMDPTDLLELLLLIARKQPKVVLELGSRTSSTWIAYALEKDGGSLISVNHKTEFADRTKSFLYLHDVSHFAEVRLAEPRQLDINGESSRV